MEEPVSYILTNGAHVSGQFQGRIIRFPNITFQRIAQFDPEISFSSTSVSDILNGRSGRE
jgi:hypothetical protein